MAIDYLNPDYDLWGRQATDRVNNLYSGYEDQIRALHQQTQDFNAQQAQSLNAALAQRYGDLQRSQTVGAADLAGQGIQQDPRVYYGMQALQNAANAQNTYQQQQQQLAQNLTNDRMAGVGRMRAAFQSGIQGSVYDAKAQQALAQQQAAAAAARSGGGGRSGSGANGQPSDADIMARMRMLNSGATRKERGIDWLKSNYGNVSNPTIRAVYNSLIKTRGAAAQELMTKYGATRHATNWKGHKLSKVEPVNPRIYQMLTDFIKQRNAYHDSIAATPYTWQDAYQSLLSEQG